MQVVDLRTIVHQREIAAGGEGKIFEHATDKKKVVKIYHKPRSASFVDHLEKLRKLPKSFVAPTEVYTNSRGECVGFEMKYVNLNNYWLFNNLFNKGFCTSNGITRDFKISVLNKLKTDIEILHSQKIVVGDLNQYNMFFSAKGDILFVDVDSYATPTNPHSGVLLEDIRDFTTSDINSQTDSWAYDVLAFWATTHCHPFKWVLPGDKESLESRVKHNRSILSKINGIKIPPVYEPPVGDNLLQFSEIFSGRRYMISLDKVHTQIGTVVKQPTVSNSLLIRELYDNVTHFNACDDFIALRIGADWLLVETKIQKLTREVKRVACDELYPAFDTFAYRKGNSLFSGVDGVYRKDFFQPEFYYSGGFLTVVDYGNDTQWNYNLNFQIGGIDSTQTPVFAKSILKRNALIQNFGSKQMMNVPVKNSYSLIPVPDGTKDGTYHRGYVAVEHKTKSAVEYSIRKDGNILDLDYLPFFTSSPKNVIFVPEDGFIDVYGKDMELLTRFDCSICTRSSKLSYSNSGILVLENNKLYLTNTK